MTRNEIVQKTEDYIKQEFSQELAAHDWFHIQRVCRQALAIAKKEGGDKFIIKMVALLHDLDDFKFNDDSANIPKARKWLDHFPGLAEEVIKKICDSVAAISFKGAGVKNKIASLEGQIVQDADRLDALGAIGIARVFTFSGSRSREIYNPSIKPRFHKTFAAYKKHQTTAINHFYEKLLLLKDLLNTPTAQQIAKKRHQFMEKYLEQFFAEWRGKK
jgi:uncharacterized protein